MRPLLAALGAALLLAPVTAGGAAAQARPPARTSRPAARRTSTEGFTATVSGAISATLKGDAVLQDVAVTGDDSTTSSWITLTIDRAADHRIQLSRSQRGVPAVGTYAIVDSRDRTEPPDARAGWSASYERGTSNGDANFTARSGTLEITASSPTGVSGRFTFTAVDDAGDDGKQITVTGRFTAPKAEDRVRR